MSIVFVATMWDVQREWVFSQTVKPPWRTWRNEHWTETTKTPLWSLKRRWGSCLIGFLTLVKGHDYYQLLLLLLLLISVKSKLNLFWLLQFMISYIYPSALSDCPLRAEACSCFVHQSLGTPCTGRVQSVCRFVRSQKTSVPLVTHPAHSGSARLRAAPAAPRLPAQRPRSLEHRGRLRVHLLSARWVLPERHSHSAASADQQPDSSQSCTTLLENIMILIRCD